MAGASGGSAAGAARRRERPARCSARATAAPDRSRTQDWPFAGRARRGSARQSAPTVVRPAAVALLSIEQDLRTAGRTSQTRRASAGQAPRTRVRATRDNRCPNDSRPAGHPGPPRARPPGMRGRRPVPHLAPARSAARPGSAAKRRSPAPSARRTTWPPTLAC